MKTLRIYTNNPLVEAKYPEITHVCENGAQGVLITARDKVHHGAKLVCHPLSGCVLPGISPYKSLIITDIQENIPQKTDFNSLTLIEEAIRALKKPPEGFSGYDEKTLEDFRVLDLDLIQSALAGSGFYPGVL